MKHQKNIVKMANVETRPSLHGSLRLLAFSLHLTVSYAVWDLHVEVLPETQQLRVINLITMEEKQVDVSVVVKVLVLVVVKDCVVR